MRKFVVGLGALAVAAGMVFAGASEASAAARNGVCEVGEFCYYYNSGQKGSVSDFTSSVRNLGDRQPKCYDFKGVGAGKGLCVKNHAASVWNRTSRPVTVYYNSGYSGKSQTIAPGSMANLVPGLKNNNASHLFGAAPSPIGPWASPVPSTARVSAGFGRYPSGGPHNGVDYAYRGDVYSACSGTVDSVKINSKYANRNAYKVRGSTNYVWINCGGGIRMGYAHFFAKELPSWVKVGAKVQAGARLFPVGNQGNSSGYHLHFEVHSNGKPINGHKFLKDQGVRGLPHYPF